MGLDRNTALRLAWKSGNLEYMVEDYQLVVYRALWSAILNPAVLKYALNIARRFGKTHTASIVAVEFAIRFPNSIINYAAPTGKEMNKILRSIMPVILAECPADLKPERKNGTYEFPNGSIIYTAGVNAQHADDLRGNKADLNIVDEAGQIDELEYLVSSVLLPMQLTTKGTMLLLSTPPSQTDHDFTKMYHECMEEGNSLKLTYKDNAKVMADPELLLKWIKEYGGEESTAWKREFLCEFVTDSNKIIIPEWEQWKETNTRVSEPTEKSQFWHKYVGMDLGFRDLTGLIYGHYDFERAKLVIERDFTLVGEEVTSESIATGTLKIEEELWGDQKPRRISDNNQPILLNDIQLRHQVLFHPTNKDELHAMVNKTRLFIGSGRLEIDPCCTYLLGCLEFGVWDKKRESFSTSKKYGHYDHLAALIYMLRYVDEHTNPVPPLFGLKVDDHWIDPKIKLSENAKGFARLARTKRVPNGAY